MTFKIFGFQILIYKPKHTHTVNGACKIVSDGHWLFLTDENGNRLPKQLSCTITERLNEPTKATVELFVDITELLNKGDSVKLPI